MWWCGLSRGAVKCRSSSGLCADMGAADSLGKNQNTCNPWHSGFSSRSVFPFFFWRCVLSAKLVSSSQSKQAQSFLVQAIHIVSKSLSTTCFFYNPSSLLCASWSKPWLLPAGLIIAWEVLQKSKQLAGQRALSTLSSQLCHQGNEWLYLWAVAWWSPGPCPGTPLHIQGLSIDLWTSVLSDVSAEAEVYLQLFLFFHDIWSNMVIFTNFLVKKSFNFHSSYSVTTVLPVL